MKAANVLETIGNTPHIRLARLFPDHEVWVKSERTNPGGSIKDRIALSMVEDAEKSGALKPGGTIIEPTSGNTGIGLAMVAAVKGYKLVLVMPESMSLERRRLMLAYGASFDLTPREQGMKGALERAQELINSTENSWMPQQFENAANVAVHVRTTAKEILADFADNPVDVLITGVGTGGHLTGCAEELKRHWSGLKAYAVEPTLSPDGSRIGAHIGGPNDGDVYIIELDGRMVRLTLDGTSIRPRCGSTAEKTITSREARHAIQMRRLSRTTATNMCHVIMCPASRLSTTCPPSQA